MPPASAERESLVLAEPAAHVTARPIASGDGLAQAGRFARRVVDVVAAALLLVCLLPLLLIVALLIKLDSPGPVLFRQRRLGKDLRPFTMLKFRTMEADAKADAHIDFIAKSTRAEDGPRGSLKKLTDDPRITRVGRPLRRLSIDELPQLLNVLAGHMALVGPRPALDYELDFYEPAHFDRFGVRPGITGLWQVSGRSSVGFTQMLDLDTEYARTATFATDVRILVRTPWAAIRDAA